MWKLFMHTLFVEACTSKRNNCDWWTIPRPPSSPPPARRPFRQSAHDGRGPRRRLTEGAGPCRFPDPSFVAHVRQPTSPPTREAPVRKLIVSEFMTLDGVMQ